MKRDKTEQWLRRRSGWRRRGALPLAIFLILAGLSCAYINSNQIYRLLGRTTKYDAATAVGRYRVELSEERQFENAEKAKFQLRDLKLSFPLSANANACELFYAAAILRFREGAGVAPGPGQFSFRNTRLLLKFRYDLKHKRCESKDIPILNGDVPELIQLQIVRITLSSTELLEVPEPLGLEVRFPQSHRVAARSITIPPGAPFLSAAQTRRSLLFSVAQVQNPELMIHPYESLSDFVAQELTRRIERCRSGQGCAPILMSVAKITDRKVLELLDQARAAGLPVEAISNYRYRLDQEMDDWTSGPEEFQYSPWFWLRGSPFSQYGAGRLPMHTKFIVFGDDFVVSSNPSLRGGLRNRSREYSVIYRDRAVVQIFKEIFALVRSSFYYPLRVDLNHDLIVLLNAVRPRAYAVSAQKPYVAIDSDEHVRSNAYGVLYELLARNPGQLQMAMSPITDSCAPYRLERCLFELLAARAASGSLTLALNGLYYTAAQNRPAISDQAKRFWDSARFKAALDSSEALNIYRSWFDVHSEALKTYIEFSRPMSTHHERAALLGEDVSILGSANWGNTSTINTIEVLRSKALKDELQQEFASFDDPWFVSLRDEVCTNSSCFGRCEFSFEISQPQATQTASYAGSKGQLLAELKQRYAGSDADGLQLVVPNREAILARRGAAQGAAQFEGYFELQPLADQISSPSAYICLASSDRQHSYVLRLPKK